MKWLVFLLSVPLAAQSVAPVKAHTVDKKFVIVNGLQIGMAALDVSLSHRAIASGRGHEANPLMPKSLGGQIGVNVAVSGLMIGTGYWLKKHNRRWWLGPVAGIAGHTVGSISALSPRR